ncbi:MAG: DNA-binding response regulator [Desulfobacteraceae bacterium]|nr:MAG: DNA-binding response regulator [Desulfobacteraceae bacterium]
MNRLSKIRVLVVDDHKGFRKNLVSFLRQMPGVEVIGEAGDGQEAIELAMRISPDMVFMDVMMPRLNGIESASIIKGRSPFIRVILYSMYDLKECDTAAPGTADMFVPKQRLLEDIPGILRTL